jgi:hypothetical protein
MGRGRRDKVRRGGEVVGGSGDREGGGVRIRKESLSVRLDGRRFAPWMDLPPMAGCRASGPQDEGTISALHPAPHRKSLDPGEDLASGLCKCAQR